MKYVVLFTITISTLIAGATPAADYKKNCYVKPCELKGDFDGDRKTDRALLIQDKNGKKGVEFTFADGKRKILGAGIPFGNGGDNFSWMDHWDLHKGPIEKGANEKNPPKAKGDSVLLEKKASASGMAYWNGSEFEWYQQGD